MINKNEKEILIQMMANIDDIKGVMTEDQRERCKRCFERIGGNYHALLEGLPEGDMGDRLP